MRDSRIMQRSLHGSEETQFVTETVVAPHGRVWIHSPAKGVTGGPEALHQLARGLMDCGVDARIVYYPEAQAPHSIPAAYQGYDVRMAPLAEDRDGDVIVVPEVYTGRLRRVRRARRVVWWLSIDNYLLKRTPVQRVIRCASRTRPLRFEELRNVANLAQSVYAVDYLGQRGVDARLLTDYLNPVHLSLPAAEGTGGREPLVLYNPKKGAGFTRKLIDSLRSTVTWVALEGMNSRQVAALMERAMLYVDFGPHPGRDRIPREAAAHGCCVLTGRRGSAANDVDVPIPDWYKIDESDPAAIVQAGARIRAILNDYPRHHGQFSGYRAWIQRQMDEFQAQVRSVFLTLTNET